MIVKIKKYVATVAHYVEDGDKITKVLEDITITGKRISQTTVEKQIPRGCVLVKHGYIDEVYEVDADQLHAWLKANGVICGENILKEDYNGG